MQTVNPVDSATNAYREVWAQRRALFQIATIPVAGMIVLSLISSRLAGIGTLGLLISLVCQIIVAGLAALIIIGWVRAVQDQFGTVRPVLPTRPTPSEQTFLLWYVGLSVLPAFVVSLVMPSPGAMASGAATGGFFGLVVALAVLYLQLRLSFFYIELALGRSPTVAQGFAMTEGGVAWRLLGGAVLAIIPVIVVILLFATILASAAAAGNILALVVLVVIQAVISAVSVALVASVGMAFWRAR